MTGRPHLTFLVGCLALAAIVSARLGQDANWDLLNYHLYNGAALLRGRFDQDLLAAGMQSYLNPLLDALYAGLALGPFHGRQGSCCYPTASERGSRPGFQSIMARSGTCPSPTSIDCRGGNWPI